MVCIWYVMVCSSWRKRLSYRVVKQVNFLEMATNQICRHFKYGYCRFLNNCRNQHIPEICNKEDCNMSLCSERHPRRCKYFFKFHRCKFGDFCMYSHGSMESSAPRKMEVKALATKVEDLEKEIMNMKNERDRLSVSITKVNWQKPLRWLALY